MKFANFDISRIRQALSEAVSEAFHFFRDALSLPEPPYPEAFRDLANEYREEISRFPLLSVWVAYEYSREFSSDLKRFKYRAERVALEKFDDGLRRLARICRDEIPKNAFVVYPPSPLSRTLLRGYDHTALLAERFAEYAGIPVVRIVKTPFSRQRQAGNDRASRTSNVAGKFFLPAWASEYSGRPAVFFDDVVSSASTALECAKVLVENGNLEIYGCFLSSPTAVPRENDRGYSEAPKET